MTETARLVLAVDSTQVDKADDKLNKLGSRAGRTENRTGRLTKATDQLSRAYRGLGAVLATVGAGMLIREMVKAADTYTELRSQIRLVTDSQQELNEVYEDTFRVAQDTRADFEATVGLYARLARSTEDLRLSNEQLLTITKAVNQSFVVSGASAEEAEGAIRQLGQGLASGTLRGDELNSVLENSPRLARAIADSLGVTIGQLRQLGADGQITAEKITTALLDSAESIDRDFSKMERTVGQAMQQLRNDLLNTFGKTDVSPFVDAIDDLRDIVTDPGFQESMVTLGSGIAQLAGWLASATSEGVKFTKWLGEEFASKINGIAVDDIPRLEQKLEALQTALNGDFLDQDVGLVFTSDEELKRQIAETEEQIRQAEELQAMMAKLSEGTGGSTGGTSGGSGGGGSTVNLEEQEKALDAVIDSAWAYTEAVREARQADAEWAADKAGAVESLRLESLTQEARALEELQSKYRELNALVASGDLAQEEAAQIAAGLSERWAESVDEAKDSTGLMNEFAVGAARNMQSAFADFLFDPFEQGLDGMLSGFGRMLQRMVAEMAAQQLLTSLFSAMSGLGGPLGSIGTAFAGAFDSGGTIGSGQWGIVGERGPEIVQGPANVTSRKETAEMVGGTKVSIGSMNFPNVRNEREARKAAGAAAREISRIAGSGQRYS